MLLEEAALAAEEEAEEAAEEPALAPADEAADEEADLAAEETAAEVAAAEAEDDMPVMPAWALEAVWARATETRAKMERENFILNKECCGEFVWF